MIVGAQIRAARALLSWSQLDLAKSSGVGLATVKRLEPENSRPRGNVRTLEAIRTALEAAGIEFIEPNGGGPGVRISK